MSEEERYRILEDICKTESYYHQKFIKNGPIKKEGVSETLLVINVVRDIIDNNYPSAKFGDDSNYPKGGLAHKIYNLKKLNISKEVILDKIEKIRRDYLDNHESPLSKHFSLCKTHHHRRIYGNLINCLEEIIKSNTILLESSNNP